MFVFILNFFKKYFWDGGLLIIGRRLGWMMIIEKFGFMFLF